MTASVRVRMYNPGFGDCFLVTVHDDGRTWRMLVDCGVHSHGRAKVNGHSRTIAEVVDAVIAQLSDESPDGKPYLDVIVATHRHADHIAGFVSDAWTQVEVAEVWVPFVEDPEDDDAKTLRHGLAAAADDLEAISTAVNGKPADGRRPALAMAHDFAANFAFSGNALATERLVGGRFRGDPQEVRVRFLPDRDPAANSIDTGIPGVRVEVLGPSRDPAYLTRMDPPRAVRWLKDAAGEALPDSAREQIFDPIYHVPAAEVPERVGRHAVETRDRMRLGALAVDEEAVLTAASLLERSVNNTSVFFVLDVRGDRFVFVGDSQQGAWEHVLDDPRSRALVTGAKFYKVGHHGSHNATPTTFVRDAVGEASLAMIPVGPVKAWVDSIPYPAILDAFLAKKTRLIRADQPPAPDDIVSVGPDGLWVEATFAAPDR